MKTTIGLLTVCALFVAGFVRAEVVNNISAYAESGSGGSSSATVTTSVNGEVKTTSVTGEGAVTVHVSDSAGTATPPPPGALPGAVDTTKPTPPPIKKPIPVSVVTKGSANVKVVGDDVTITLSPVNGGKANVLKINKAKATEAILVADLDGDGAPDTVPTNASSSASGVFTKDLVIKADQIRGNIDILNLVEHTTLWKSHTEVKDEKDLALLASRAILEDGKTSSVVFGENALTIQYNEDAKLFGFLPVAMWQKVEVGADGRVKVVFPWWAAFAKKSVGGLEYETEIKAALDAESSTISRQNSSILRQAALFTTVSNVLKTKHDTAKNSVANIR